jgi:murein L,D-transpeptidase YcbB/YkuD
LNGQNSFRKNSTVNHIAKRALCAALTLALVPAAPAVAAAADSASNSTSVATARFGAFTPVSAPRSILIDAASATLYMMEGGRIVDSMKVIVGKPSTATPEMKTSLTYATLNPYWHLSPDEARTLTAPNVLKQGLSYLYDRGYEVVSSFDDNHADIIDPSTVDWQAVADGRQNVLVRQRPGPANSLGHMKFSLASGDGIFLHDTPKKELFDQDQRDLSHGCVRLEDAPRLAHWLLGDSVPMDAAMPEERIPLDQYVPVTITYLPPQVHSQLAALR